MTTYASEPGTRLGGRYRLEDRIAAGSGWAAWKAIDETLARAVTVFTFAAGYPRVTEVITAARAASRLADPRLAHVFDVEDTWDRAYIVMEWAAGETLGDLLSQGPLEPFRAARMISEAAAALSSAHAAGVAHMCLSPGSVRWSPTGEVKVVGLGIDAALSGVAADDPVLADTRGLGMLLYAALTGYWPGPEYPPLRPAPLSGGQPCSPRQVTAGVPDTLSELTCRAMQLRSAQGAPLTTPADLARALVAVLPPAPPPAAAPAPQWRNQTGRYQDDDRHQNDGRYRDDGRYQRETSRYQNETARYQSDPQYGQGWHGDADARRRRLRGRGEPDWDGARGSGDGPGPSDDDGRLDHDGQPRHGRRRAEPAGRLWGGRIPKGIIVGVGVLVLIAVAAFTLQLGGGGSPSTGPSTKPTSPAASVTTLTPAAATGFDPLGHNDPGNEQTKLAPLAIDASKQTMWVSQWYASASFGGEKSGAGLMIDMGKSVRFSKVTVTFSSQPGSDVELRVGNSATPSAGNLALMTKVAAQANATGTVPFQITSTVRGQYLLIWFTKLPLSEPAHPSTPYAAQVFDVVVQGTA